MIRERKRLAVSVATFAVVLVSGATVLAPTAVGAAELAFAPGTFVKAHPPLDPQMSEDCSEFLCRTVGHAEYDHWIAAIEEAPEPTQAGGHPDFLSSFRFPPDTENSSSERVRTLVGDIAVGAVINPRGVPLCKAADFYLTVYGACPPISQVGVAVTLAAGLSLLDPVSSMMLSPEEPDVLAFKAGTQTAILRPEVRSDGDYRLQARMDDLPSPPPGYLGTTIDLWGVPHDPVHDRYRFNDSGTLGDHIDRVPKPFLSAPTSCRTGPIALGQAARSWERPEHWIEISSTAAEPTGCEKISFEPSVSALPTTDVADSPSGLKVDLHLPQHEDCRPIEPPPAADQPQYACDLATSQLEDTAVRLPEGIWVNPAAANGLLGCSASQAGLTSAPGQTPIRFDGKPTHCPGGSWIGDAEVDTPLRDQPLQGSVFLAEPYDNPFKSMLALYLALDDPERGVVATLPGRVEADPDTGQLTATFPETPQLPFERLRIVLKQGPHALLRTPSTCGAYTTAFELAPYSAPQAPVGLTEEWSIAKGPGASCAKTEASLPNSPSFEAGNVSPVAGAFSPFVLRLARADGSQSLRAIEVSPPPGMVAKLVGVAQCPDASLAAAAAGSGKEEHEHSSCPAGSDVGEAVVGLGSGPSPYYVSGHAYLAGPYKGAPLSLAIVVPATAGPFDLGTIVVRAAIYLDLRSARLTAVSDPIPGILGGIPLDVRTVNLVLDREQFVQTGTSCDPGTVVGAVTSALGQVAPLLSRSQLGDCRQLGFKPRVSLGIFGNLARNGHPSLRAVFRPRGNEAGLQSAAVGLPDGELLDIHNLRALCPRQLPAGLCPAGSRLGYARIASPMLEGTLRGPIYVRAPSRGLPDLLVDLRLNHFHLLLNGRTTTSGDRLGVRFDALPDVPVSKAAFTLEGGPRGIFVNSESLCRGPRRARVRLSAHNGRLYRLQPRLRVQDRC
jgi:hypothetical protein